MRAPAVALLLLLASPAAAQTAPDVRMVIYAASGLGAHRAPVERAAVRVLGERVSSRRLDDESCVPMAGDASCVAVLLRGTRAGLLLHASIEWARGACVPMRRDGAVVGHRMLRTPRLRLSLYDLSGALVGSSETEIAAGADVTALAEASIVSLLERRGG
jgi:hypothetical protein